MSYKNSKVLIMGLGLNEGGVGSAKYFAREGADVIVTDLKDEKVLAPSIEKLKDYPDIKFHLGNHSKEDIDWADIVIRNQAIKITNPLIEYAIEKGKKVRTDIGIFLEYVTRDQLICVTGTKGKSTTASLIYEVLKAEGRNVVLLGNIGRSVLESVDLINKDSLVVLEISSFQIESFDRNKISPKYAVITNIYPDHLNYYSSMDEYINAKRLLAVHQNENDFLFLNKNDKNLNNDAFLEGLKSQIIFFSSDDLPPDFKPQLPGNFNLSNFAATLSVVRVLEVNEDQAIKTLQNFKGVKFRMELIKEINGIKIYNNTTATAPEPAIESLKTFPNSILICGGMNKGLSFEEFAKAIDHYAKAVYFLEGEATDEIIEYLKQFNSSLVPNKTYNNIEVLLKDVKEIAQTGDVILFSPGATSFNLYQNEFDRGKKFNEAVERIFNVS